MFLDGNARSPLRIARLAAVLAGAIGVMLCAVVPLLPAKQTTATIIWPQGTTAGGGITEITAPLVSGAPQALDITIPCSVIASLPTSGGLVLSTLPSNGVDTGKNGLFVRANKDDVIVAFRDTVAAIAPRTMVAASTCSALHLWAHPGGVGASFLGIPGASGTLSGEKKPQFGGIFTDLKVPAQAGLSARIDVDTRFLLRPTAIKEIGLLAGALAVLVAIIALAVLDRRSGHTLARHQRRRVR
ncbi:MAG: arabinosyltransferase, partial [Mycobacteriaceae bacterium]|nr:arabinosyltransferase [Mycobacteriaceae bacterium]